MQIVNRLLSHPLTRGLSVDDPNTTLLRREIILGKPFLKALYTEWYELILNALTKADTVFEVGAGAGFLDQFLPHVISSEIFKLRNIDVVADACSLPIANHCLDAIVMTDVFHHIPDVNRFLSEASRCIRPGGKIIMIEPWRTPWSEWIYKHLHSEPFVPDSGWEISSTGPLSGANGALPWIVFERDRKLFEMRFPELRIVQIHLLMPFSYIFSGGVSMRSLLPGWMFKPLRLLEKSLDQKRWAMFALIELELLNV